MTMKTITKRISLQVFILLSIMIAGLVACCFVSYAVVGYHHQTYLEGTRRDLVSYCTRVSNQMQNSGYLTTTNSTIDNELHMIADLYEGRVLVTDKVLKIVFDSYDMELGKTLVSKNAIKTLNGNNIMYTDEEKERAVLLLPIVPTGQQTTEGIIIILFSIKNELQHIESMGQNAFAYTMLALIVLVFVAIGISRALTKPLKQVTRSLRHISEGFMNERISVNNYKEVSVISDSANGMLAKINQLEASRQEFVSNVSHELKTPMTSMKVLSDALLSAGDELPEMYREFLQDINNEIDRENAIISDLLTLVRMDKKGDRLNPAPCQMNELLGIILKRVKPLAEASDIEIVLESYRDVVADVDEVKLIIALTNITENAVKYNRVGGYVHITLNADLNYCYVTIEDNGYGIPEEAVPRIFDRFYRVDKDRARESGGTGLGLAISKDIITAHKGLIKVYSREDEGTTFTIRLPLVNQKLRRDTEASENMEVGT